MKHRHAHAQRVEMNSDDVNVNRIGEGGRDDIIGIRPARSGKYMSMTWNVARQKAKRTT